MTNIDNDKKLMNVIDTAKAHAVFKGGECLSKEYINSKTKLEWKCENPTHKTWFTKYSHIKEGTWCPECGKENMRNKRMLVNGLQKAKKHALSKKGQCLSNECLNSQSKLEWKCHDSKHPSWFATYSGVINKGSWCRQCRIELDFPKEKYLKLAKAYAISKNGICLSKEYINNRQQLEWKCHNTNHKSWFAVYTSTVNTGSWCPECGIIEVAQSKILKDGLDKAQKYAISKKGHCLSTEYIHSIKNMEWKCHKATHSSWFSSYRNVVINKSWCIQCGNERNLQEFRVQQILNYLFKTKFIKTRKLPWNINPKTGKNLELDGYSKELNMAFEFQGFQHYKDNIYKKSSLEAIQYRDKCKKDNCRINNILLIIIDQINNNKKCINFFNSILLGIENSGIEVPEYNYKQIEKLYKLSPENDLQEKQFRKCEEYALSKLGKILSNEYINNSTKMEWKCNNVTHTSWEGTYKDVVTKNSWCPECCKENLRKKFQNPNGLIKAQDYAKARNGQCLSKEYININNKLEWKCHNKNHSIFYSSYNNIIKKNRWCMACKKEDMIKKQNELNNKE